MNLQLQLLKKKICLTFPWLVSQPKRAFEAAAAAGDLFPSSTFLART